MGGHGLEDGVTGSVVVLKGVVRSLWAVLLGGGGGLLLLVVAGWPCIINVYVIGS